MKILLIAGHGAGDPGAVATIKGKKYREADETRALVSYIVPALKEYGVDVTVYDTGRNAYSDYKSGALASIAQFSKYDYVLEIHFNAFKYDKGDGEKKGVECYVTTSEKGVLVEETICKNIASIGFTNRGVKRNNWAVITKAKASGPSSALLEVCFIDDADDMAVYTKSRQKIAKAVADGIAVGYGLKKKESEIDIAKKTIKAKAGLSDSTIDYLAAYKYGSDLLKKLAAAMK